MWSMGDSMDYFAEIAESPDIEEALECLRNRVGKGDPAEVRQVFDPLAAAHTGVRLAVLVNAFHASPDFAADVWLALGACTSERQRLSRAVDALPWSKPRPGWFHPNRWLQWRSWRRREHTRIALELQETSSSADCQKGLGDASHEQLVKTRDALGLPQRGPGFLEKLVDLDPPDGDTVTTASGRMKAIAALIRNPEKVRKTAETYGVPVPFTMVHAQELEQIDQTRRADGRALTDGRARERGGAPLLRALNLNLVGLAFSGGGIRSATFNLGVLQGLAKLNILRHCDYLSTVSGGGYIGSWFSAWMRREACAANGHGPLADDLMRQRLSPSHSPIPLDRRVRPIRYLREFSNYLTPQTGFFSADTWTMVAIYVRNVLLNWLVLIPMIAAVLLVPRLVFTVMTAIEPWSGRLILLLIVIPLCVLLPNLRRASPPKDWFTAFHRPVRRDDGSGRVPWYARQGTIQVVVVLPFLLAACLTALRYWTQLQEPIHATPLKPEFVPAVQAGVIAHMALTAGCVFLVYLGIIHWFGRFYRCYRSIGQAVLALVLATIGAALAAAGLFWTIGHILLSSTMRGLDGPWLALAFGTSGTLATYSFIVVIQLGLLGAKFPDEQREWWSRLRAWTLIYSLGWMGLFISAMWIPEWVGWLAHKAGETGARVGGVGAVIAWALSTFAGIKAGGSDAVAKDGRAGAGSPLAVKVPAPVKARALRVVALLAPYIFIAGLVALISLGVDALLALRSGPPHKYWDRAGHCPPEYLFAVVVVLVMLSVFMSWRIGVNEFSMHHFYKNRLVRCYLGASRWQSRKADWFTGFDSEDDPRLADFDRRRHDEPEGPAPYSGPYPIVNAALNLVAGEDLAWQERKAASFVFTPKYCGYDIDRAVLHKDKGDQWPDAYAPTHHYVVDGAGPTLGTAMAISGAAANPNMGRVTSAASAFLMTVFNARLGWWLPNPRRPGGWLSAGIGWRRWLPKRARFASWDSAGPTLGISYTAIELFGLTDDEKKYINVSDGGHFENLGVYELIRRGCRYVILSDAGQDGAFCLEDLGNLIRKCRIDFGVEIEIGTDSIRDLNAKGWSATHCVVGKIHYLNVPQFENGQLKRDAAGQPEHEVGLLLYMKPSITGDEPFDVLEYYRRVPEFPHESTADQWFNESQFESYRRLGLHIGETTFQRRREVPDEPLVGGPKALFEFLWEFWHPPSPRVAERSTAHAEQYSHIMELLREKHQFEPLDRVLFPEIKSQGLVDKRSEFYVCNALIQLMENVYTDLDLEQYHKHPHVVGWMTVFKQWASQDAFGRTWMISKDTYAKRFQNFYEDRLVPKRNGAGQRIEARPEAHV